MVTKEQLAGLMDFIIAVNKHALTEHRVDLNGTAEEIATGFHEAFKKKIGLELCIQLKTVINDAPDAPLAVSNSLRLLIDLFNKYGGCYTDSILDAVLELLLDSTVTSFSDVPPAIDMLSDIQPVPSEEPPSTEPSPSETVVLEPVVPDAPSA